MQRPWALLVAALAVCEPGGELVNAGQDPSSDTVDATIAEIVASPDLLGRKVRVTGRCLDVPYLRPIGPPPRTRRDWQITDGGGAIYVTGSFPGRCSANEPLTIVAKVAEVTRPSLKGSQVDRTSRYLIRIR